MTIANQVTVGRILLVPFFVIQVLYYERTGDEWHRLAALLTFALATLTDALDGYLARRYHQYTELGALLDPVADKILLVSALVLLTFDKGTHLPNLPLWLAGTVIGRDAVQAIGLAVTHYTVGKVPIRPRLVGKAATLLLMVTVIWALLKWDAGWLRWLAISAAVCTGISGVLYVLDGMKLLSASPDSAPKAESSPKTPNS
ncbi:MAG: CDP-alcohol phosphatidyltransferase family protein [Verrucomicrobia bacterium]|nr:CDP-alcohol phosphatidyltransferase family protein [Verrucomicrobiota bacterium]NBU09024.1 CDP-alcohol phosphatidyltransferase family protein [Pseudomonadota bacterium]NDA68994.1 CDP-alcohol phosphatidyltransferase family protein [Verrucomicrobiota bacterium]NDD40413.1 CDP-alcohol phosphatidyltransferase family protein [Verrucomicrobiota bacterium]NDF01093.1 CDP-alcohol phosphatidyltransferase family protein [Verrucomicrobiota bacterium]